jgi:hypothetical protein
MKKLGFDYGPAFQWRGNISVLPNRCLRLIRIYNVKVLDAVVPRLQNSIQPCAAFPYVSAGSPLMLTHSPLAASTSPGSLLACGLGF